MSDYDVIVVGARCAGAPTAMLLARRGHRVLLLDKARFPSDTLSTHLVKPRAIAYLDHWGLRDALEARETVYTDSSSFRCEGLGPTGSVTREALRACMLRDHGWEGRTPEPPAGEPAWACIRRTELDHVLVEAACAAGVVLHEGTRVDGLLRDDEGSVVGVRGPDGAALARAKVVIGADGRHSRIAALVDAAVVRESRDCGFAYYSYFAGLDLTGLDIGVHLRGRLGLGYFPTNHGLVMVSVWGPGEWASSFRQDVAANFQDAVRRCDPRLAARLERATRETKTFGTIDQQNRVRQASGPGWALVGDAGYHVDQCTAIGITHSFRAAEWLAAELDRGLTGAVPMREALARYERRVLATLDGYFDYVCRIAASPLPSAAQLAMFEALGRHPSFARQFFDFSCALIDAHAFPGDEGQRLLADMGGVPSAAVLQRFEAARPGPGYLQDPWT